MISTACFKADNSTLSLVKRISDVTTRASIIEWGKLILGVKNELNFLQINSSYFLLIPAGKNRTRESLIEASKKENNITISSIFVNPAQFNDPKDFEKYPVTIEKDILLLEKAGCDVLFIPSVKEIYPDGIAIKKHYDLGYIETVLDGKFRPGHFQGVSMVVQRLLEIVLPDRLYLGQKDYQQCMVITKLIELIGLKEKIPCTMS